MITLNNKKICENCFSETTIEPCPHCGFVKAACRIFRVTRRRLIMKMNTTMTMSIMMMNMVTSPVKKGDFSQDFSGVK